MISYDFKLKYSHLITPYLLTLLTLATPAPSSWASPASRPDPVYLTRSSRRSAPLKPPVRGADVEAIREGGRSARCRPVLADVVGETSGRQSLSQVLRERKRVGRPCDCDSLA